MSPRKRRKSFDWVPVIGLIVLALWSTACGVTGYVVRGYTSVEKRGKIACLDDGRVVVSTYDLDGLTLSDLIRALHIACTNRL